MYDLIIIGAGPGGLTAAIYAKRAGLKVAIIEKDAPGGKMVKTAYIQNWPGYSKVSGTDLATAFFEQVIELGVDYLYGEVLNIEENKNSTFKITTNMDKYIAKKIIVATGTKEKRLNIPGEETFYGRGVSYCAVCDGALYANQDMVVVGGGNAALEEAIYLTRFAKTIYLVHRRQEFRAESKLVEELKKYPQIKVLTNTVLTKINGDRKVSNVEVKNLVSNDLTTIETPVVFLFIGSAPENKFLDHFNLQNDNQYFIVDENFQTSKPGIFAIGDVIKKNLRQIVTATNDGAIAANYIAKLIKDNKN